MGLQALEHDIESRTFLGDEQNGLATSRALGNEIGDSLARPCSWWTADHAISAAKGL
jgi:hypothetical protein